MTGVVVVACYSELLAKMQISEEIRIRIFLLAYDPGWEYGLDERPPERPLPLAVASRLWNRVYWLARWSNDGFGPDL